jgi:hypothetical protein
MPSARGKLDFAPVSCKIYYSNLAVSPAREAAFSLLVYLFIRKLASIIWNLWKH